MKICLCTTPIRPVPTTFPPFGSMAIIQSLREIGENPLFYNIDFFRFSQTEIKEYFRKNKFDIVAISAVVSTAYTYTKYLASLIKKESPNSLIILGGNLAASAEILLRRSHIDICVIGDGEIIIQNLFKKIKLSKRNFDYLSDVKGLAFINKANDFHFTGYGDKPSGEAIKFPDYSILEEDGSLDYFISNKLDDRILGYEGELDTTKKVAMIVMNKGCVARCTFCHRFEKGYRVIPKSSIINHIQYLKNKYNVGYLIVADENFGADRKVTADLVEELGKLKIPWQVAGVRARTVSKQSLIDWKNNGCYLVLFGIESGSESILTIMEKHATVEENFNALKWTGEADLSTVIQLVLGMPGESDKTINETISFLKKALPYIKIWKNSIPSESLSINYAQALPGTPLYEYARNNNLIGKKIEDEEKYLISISDTDAYKEDHFINMTGLPILKVLTWRPLILAHIDAYHYQQQNQIETLGLLFISRYYLSHFFKRISNYLKKKSRLKNIYYEKIFNDFNFVTDSGYFNINSGVKFAPLILNPITRKVLYPILIFVTNLRTSKNLFIFTNRLIELLVWKINLFKSKKSTPIISLRKVIKIQNSNNTNLDPMLPLRNGR